MTTSQLQSNYSFTEKKRIRKNFGKRRSILEVPFLLAIQVDSYREFLQADKDPNKRDDKGLHAALKSVFPIVSYNGYAALEYVGYKLGEPVFDERECRQRGMSYGAPLRVTVRLVIYDRESSNKAIKYVKEQEVYMGEIPLMTENGTFIVNGTERVIVSQLHRSPGVFFGQSTHANGTKLYSARIIPFRGSWIEFATDINNVMYAYIDRKKKLPVTTLLRAIGLESDKDIIEIFGLAEEVKVNKTNLKKCIGRKFAARLLKTWVEDFVDEDTGEVVSIDRNEVLIDRETVIEEHHIQEILDSGAQTILLHKEDVNTSDYSIISLLNAYVTRMFNGGNNVIAVVGEPKTVALATRIQHAAACNLANMVDVINGNVDHGVYGTIDGYDTAAKICGMISGISCKYSLTHTVMSGITKLNERLKDSEIKSAELGGGLVLTENPTMQVWIDAAITTLVTPAANQDAGWKKIRRTKTRFELLTRCNNTIDEYVGQVDNDNIGRLAIKDAIETVGIAMKGEGKINSLAVSEDASHPADGDSCWFIIDVIDKDSAEHIYLRYLYSFSTRTGEEG